MRVDHEGRGSSIEVCVEIRAPTRSHGEHGRDARGSAERYRALGRDYRATRQGERPRCLLSRCDASCSQPAAPLGVKPHAIRCASPKPRQARSCETFSKTYRQYEEGA